MKVAIKAYLTHVKYDWSDEASYTLDSSDMSSCGPAYVVIRQETFDVEIPDDFDPRPLQVAALRKEKSKVLAEAEAKATNIEEQIQRLLCIEAPKDIA